MPAVNIADGQVLNRPFQVEDIVHELLIAAAGTADADGADLNAVVGGKAFGRGFLLFVARQDLAGEPNRQPGAKCQACQRSLQESSPGQITTIHDTSP